MASVFYFRNYIDEHKVAIVCSARSGSTKALGTTNLLLRAASEALRGSKPATSTGSPTPVTRGLFGVGGRATSSNGSDQSHSPPQSRSSRSASPTSGLLNGFTTLAEQESAPDFYLTVDLVKQQHLDAARETVSDLSILQELEEEIERDCEWLRNFLLASKVC